MRGCMCCAMVRQASCQNGVPRRQQAARRLEGTHAIVVPARQVEVSVGAEVTWPRSQVHRWTAQGHAVCGLRDGVTIRRSPFRARRGGRVWTRGPFGTNLWIPGYPIVSLRPCNHVWFLACWSLVGRNQLTSHDVCLAGDAFTRAPTQRACEEGKSKCHG